MNETKNCDHTEGLYHDCAYVDARNIRVRQAAARADSEYPEPLRYSLPPGMYPTEYREMQYRAWARNWNRAYRIAMGDTSFVPLEKIDGFFGSRDPDAPSEKVRDFPIEPITGRIGRLHGTLIQVGEITLSSFQPPTEPQTIAEAVEQEIITRNLPDSAIEASHPLYTEPAELTRHIDPELQDD